MKRLATILFIATFGSSQLFAQLIDVTPEVSTACNGGAVTLNANVTQPGSNNASGSLPTDSYRIDSIGYSPNSFGAGTVVSNFAGSILGDDAVSQALSIGFNFCFYGNTYSQFYVGTNGWISFSAGQPDAYTSAPIPSTAANVPKNCIMGPWQDWIPENGAGYPNNIRYTTVGTAPNRKLIVSWNKIPLYSAGGACDASLGTFQIVIYESSNVIENYIKDKPNCPATSTAVLGIHNSTGTAALTLTGRNSTVWTATNEGWRYTPNGAATYNINWYILPANTLVGTGTSITVTPTTSPEYYYAQVSGPSGCGVGTPATDTVFINSETVIANAGRDTVICIGDSVLMNASGGFTYSWAPATGLSNPNIANPKASPNGITTYTVTITGILGCVSTDVVIVDVNPLPLVDAGPSSGLCIGDNIMMGGNGSAGTYSWSPGATLDDPTSLTPIATPTITTTYTLTITSAQGCMASDTASVIILTPIANAGLDTAICPGTSTTLNASGGDTYSWSPVTGLSDPAIFNPIADPTVTTTYTVVVTNSSSGCSAIDSVTVTILPAVIADAGQNVSICKGNNTTLGASGGSSYAWTPTTSISDPSIFNPVASATTTTTYTVIVTAASGCVSSDSVKVTVNNLPVVFAGNDIGVCTGDSVQLNATGALSFLWSPGATLSDSTISNPKASPPSLTTYIVTGTDVNGCIDTDTIKVSINGLVLTMSPNTTTICSGDSTVLNVSGGQTYIWSPASTLDNATISNPKAKPIGTTTYTVTGTDSNGCSATSTVTVNVNLLPVVNAGTSLSVCLGSNANLSVGPGSNATLYSWSPAASLNNPNIPNPIATPFVTTLYTLTGTKNGCSATDTITVVVNQPPAVSAGSNTSICLGASTQLAATGVGSFSWAPSAGLSNGSIANPVATPVSTTTYTATLTGAGFCTASAQVTITVNSVPTATASTTNSNICNGTSTQLNATGGGTYFWTPHAGLSNSQSANTTATPTGTTKYIITVSNAAGCIDTASVIINVSNAIIISSVTVVDETCSNGDGSISVGNVTGGNAPYSYSLNGSPSQPSALFPSLATGTYLLSVKDATGCTTSQTIVVGQLTNIDASFTANPPSGPKPLPVSFTNTSTGATNYVWNFGNGSNAFSTNASTIYPNNGTYIVTLYASNGPSCIDSSSVTINVFEEVAIIIPNIFTPNGDGHNDVFVIQSSGVSEINGSILNRWGKKVFEWTGDANSGWDGKINGGSAQDGTYYYILKIKTNSGEEKEEKGYVQALSN